MNVGIRDAIAYFRDGSVSLVHKGLGLLAILYVFSPVDLIPDVVPLLGWMDDVGVVAFVAAYYIRQIGQHRAKALPDRTAQVIDVEPMRKTA